MDKEERMEAEREEQLIETEESKASGEEALPEEKAVVGETASGDAAEGDSAAGEETGEAPKGKEKSLRGRARKEAELKKELEQLKEDQAAALAAEKDKYLRLAAEYDNYRKRSQKERENVYTDAVADTVAQLLPVYDNLERALRAECADPAFYRGVAMIMDQLMEVFDRLGVKAIPAAGQSFDPALHNAVMHVEDGALAENVVAEEFQKGFTLNGKVIRFAMVKVAN